MFRSLNLVRSSRTVNKIALTAGLALTTAVTAMPAQAEDENLITYTFEASKLDTNEGIASVYKDIKFKAKRACRSESPWATFVKRECVNDIVNQLVSAVDSAALTDYHVAKAPAKYVKLASN